MKKKLILMIFFLLVLVLCSCNADNKPTVSSQPEDEQPYEDISEAPPAPVPPEEQKPEEPYTYAAEDEYWKNPNILPLCDGMCTVEGDYCSDPGDRTEYPVFEKSWATEYFDSVICRLERDTNRIFYPERYFPVGDSPVHDEIVTSGIRFIIEEYNKIVEETIDVLDDRFPAEREDDMWNDKIYCRAVLISDLQKVFDFFFGKDRFDVSEWSGDMYFCSDDGYFYFMVLGEGGYCPVYRYGLLSVEYEGDEAILTINQVDNLYYELRDALSDNMLIGAIEDDGKYYDSKNLMETFRNGIPINIDNLGSIRIRISKEYFPHFVCVEE